MPKPVVTFEEAIAHSDTVEGGRSVLLGNGFSIDWDAGTFHYASLFEEATLPALGVDKTDLFDQLNTRDFERVIEALKSAAKLVDLYGTVDPDLAATLDRDASVVKNGLADVLTDRHPRSADSMTDSEAESAREFLEKFGRIFTLNYDLLLYWAIIRRNVKHSPPKQDGFEWPTADGGELIWKMSAANRGQRVFYLHGALHYFVSEHRLTKLKYQPSVPLIEQIRERIELGKYPLLVTEGTADEKRERIERSAYLRYAHSKFLELTGGLFLHGVSLSANDEHILSAIESKECRVSSVYVSVFDSNSASGRALIRRAEEMSDRRQDNGGARLAVKFYDPASARVWR